MIGNWDASSALTTKPARTGTVLPATCSTGEAFFNTAAAGGQNLYLCKPDNTWTQLTAGGSAVDITTTCGVTGGPITGTGALSGSIKLDPETGASAFAIPTTDCATVIYRNNAAAVSDTIAAAGTGGNFPSGWSAWYQCAGAGGCTITPTTSTINGAASLTMPSGTSVTIQSDGSNYTAVGDVRTILPVGTTAATVAAGNDSRFPSGLTTNKVPKASTSTAIADSGITDDGTTISTTEAVNFSGSSHTRSTMVVSSALSLPSTGCVAGELAVVTSATAGQMIYENSTTGTCTWTQQVNSGGGSGVGTQSASLTFGALPDGTCADQTFGFTGITTGTQLTPGWPSGLSSGLIGGMWASASNTVTVRLCNISGAFASPGTLTYVAKIANYYLTATGTLTYSAIADGAYGSQTLTLTGATAGDPVVLGPPAALASGLIASAAVTASNIVTVIVQNLSGGYATPTGSYTATIAK